jgi:hypothetical protein
MPLVYLELLVLLVGSFMVGFILTGFGFGVGLIVVPIFAMFFSPPEVNGLVVCMILIANISTIYRYGRVQHIHSIIEILPFLVIGILIGALILSTQAQFLRLLIGVLCLSFSILQLLSLKKLIRFKIPKSLASLVGVFAGIISAIAQVGSLPVTLYFTQKNFRKEVFVSTMVLLFFFSNVAKFCSYWFFGVLNYDIFIRGISFFPLILAGSYAGYRLNKRIPQESFFYAVMGIAIFTSSMVVITSL